MPPPDGNGQEKGKVIAIKNNQLGMIKWEQLAFEGNPQYGEQLQPIDFAGGRGHAASRGGAGPTGD